MRRESRGAEVMSHLVDDGFVGDFDAAATLAEVFKDVRNTQKAGRSALATTVSSFVSLRAFRSEEGAARRANGKTITSNAMLDKSQPTGQGKGGRGTGGEGGEVGERRETAIQYARSVREAKGARGKPGAHSEGTEEKV